MTSEHEALDVGPTEPDIRISGDAAGNLARLDLERQERAAVSVRSLSDDRPTLVDVTSEAISTSAASRVCLPSRPSLPLVVPMRGVGGTGWKAIAGAIAVAFVACALVRAQTPARPATFAVTMERFGAPPRVEEIPPPSLDTRAEPPPSMGSRAEQAAGDRRKLGRLALRGGASARNVYLDGKRLVGSGARTFDVTCGPHTIAIGNRNETREVDVSCEGELVVTR